LNHKESIKLTSEHLRAARGLLRWDQADLAAASGVSLPTVKRMEKQSGTLKAHGPTLQALWRALDEAGIQLIHESEEGGIGVRLRHPDHRDSGTGPRTVGLPEGLES
jgi:transcriptional regulator with XRE-family HTH domain